jgi:hypothetical protein
MAYWFFLILLVLFVGAIAIGKGLAAAARHQRECDDERQS